MRIMIAAAALLAATPALAQYNPSYDRSVELQAQQDMDRQRMDALRNETFSAQTRLQTEQTIRRLESEREPLRVQPRNYDPRNTTPPNVGPGFAAIPDSTLADSNAKVRAASQ